MLNFTATGATQKASVSNASASVTITPASKGSSDVLLTNTGSNPCFVTPGVGSATATVAGGLPVLAGSQVVTSVAPNVDTIAAICDGAVTTTLYVTPGLGS